MINNKVLHFSEGFSLVEVNEVLLTKPNVIYYTRYIPENNELHIVNNKKGEYEITSFITQLFEYYKNNNGLSNLIKESKVKGNDSFSIIINTNEELINQLKKDLNKLLNK